MIPTGKVQMPATVLISILGQASSETVALISLEGPLTFPFRQGRRASSMRRTRGNSDHQVFPAAHGPESPRRLSSTLV